MEYRRLPTPVGGQNTDNAGAPRQFWQRRKSIRVRAEPCDRVWFTRAIRYSCRPKSSSVLRLYSTGIVWSWIGDSELYTDPSQGPTRSIRVGIQAAVVDYHLRNVSSRFDFDSLQSRCAADYGRFSWFSFNDNQLGIRLFGNRDNLRNTNQAWFRRVERYQQWFGERSGRTTQG